MTKVVITGGAGFLGSRLARELLAAGTLEVAGGGPSEISRLVLADRVPAPADLAGDARVASVVGDLADGGEPGDRAEAAVALAEADVVFHLAAAVSGECEADFDLGLRANVQATQVLLQSLREAGTNPLVVFASSVAVFGVSAEHPLPDFVDDHTAPNPQSSYGAQKVICEQLLADYSRKGFLRGRAIRLVTISVRPGKPNAAATGFLSGIIREPLAGLRATCPVQPDTEVALASPDRAISGLLSAASAPDELWGDHSPVNLPGLTTTVAEMVAALGRVAGPDAASLIDWVADAAVARLVRSWPARFRSERAARLGLAADPDFDTIIRAHLAEVRQ
ncbi:MAG TPA: D-erythronate dehydrogenase [Streptosporangiaceae bacterium]|nr:D-erythronate dehydrogenase [Streptosporangiaceae bacterium]